MQEINEVWLAEDEIQALAEKTISMPHLKVVSAAVSHFSGTTAVVRVIIWRDDETWWEAFYRVTNDVKSAAHPLTRMAARPHYETVYEPWLNVVDG